MTKSRFLIIVVLFIFSCKSVSFQEKWLALQAPTIFKAKFETTKGDFIIEAHRKWSPNGVDRLYQLIKSDFFTDVSFYRVVPDFVAQFGIQDNTELHKSWEKRTIKDEPVLQLNDSLTISFARDVKDSRSTHLFINLKNNHRLDTITFNKVKGFPAIAKVIKGGSVVHKLYNGYSNQTMDAFDSIVNQGNDFLKQNYPKLDYIKRAYLIK